MQPSKSSLNVPASKKKRRDADYNIPLTDAGLYSSWNSRHFRLDLARTELIRHVTFSLADAIPERVLRTLRKDLAHLPAETQARQYQLAALGMLEQGIGTCALADFRHARFLEEALAYNDGIQYWLLAWSVMPNHVHALIESLPQHPVPGIVQSWKRRALRWTQASRTSKSDAGQPFTWQRNFWERSITDEDDLQVVLQQIDRSPVRAGLVAHAEEWPWCSARLTESFGEAGRNPTESRIARQ